MYLLYHQESTIADSPGMGADSTAMAGSTMEQASRPKRAKAMHLEFIVAAMDARVNPRIELEIVMMPGGL